MKREEILKVGEEVHYQPEHYKADDRFENGIVKSIPEHTNESVFVVYNCGGKWHKYMNYTAALTNKRDLNIGWR